MNPANPSPEIEAAQSRAASLQRDTLGHFWRGQPLHPWNARREIFFQALESHAAKSADFVENESNRLDQLTLVEARIQVVIEKQRAANDAIAKKQGEIDATVIPKPLAPDAFVNWHQFLASASRVLWLASHTKSDWDLLRADPGAWLLEIESWADDHIEASELSSAVRLAAMLQKEHEQFVTMGRPEKISARIDSGN